jgi:hypothetical protein
VEEGRASRGCLVEEYSLKLDNFFGWVMPALDLMVIG